MFDESVARPADLHASLRILDRQKWVILVVLLVAPVAAYFFSRETPLYRASAEVIFDRQTLATTLTGIPEPSSSRPLETQAELAHEPRIAAKVVKRARVPGMTADGLLAASSVAAKKDVDGLVFSVTDPAPAVAESLATAYAKEFAVYRRRVDSQLFAATRRLLSSQIASLRVSGDVGSPLYKSLVEKQQLIDTAQGLYTSDILILKPAKGAVKIRPKPVRNAVLAFGLAIVFAAGLALVREALDTRVRTSDELGERLDFPLLGRLHKPSRHLRRANQLAMFADPGGAEAEAFRVLRANVEFVNAKAGARTIMITSAIQGEGKTTTVANLGLAFARAGYRVALVDLDLRAPYLDRFFPLDGRPGLTQVAAGSARLEQAITPVALWDGVPRDGDRTSDGPGDRKGLLEVLGSGPRPHDPGEFVIMRSVADVLEQLQGDVRPCLRFDKSPQDRVFRIVLGFIIRQVQAALHCKMLDGCGLHGDPLL